MKKLKIATLCLWVCLTLPIITSSQITTQSVSEPTSACAFSDTGVQLLNITSVNANGPNPTCEITLDLSFIIEKNNGNKFTYIHIWKAANYPNIDYKKGPGLSDLGSNILGTIAINTDVTPSVLLNTYPATGVTPLNPVNFTLVEMSLGNNKYLITLNNVKLSIPGLCSGIIDLKADVWSSQSNSGNQPPVHCVSPGVGLSINKVIIEGNIDCNDPYGPREYNLSITTNESTPFSITYKIYLDNGDNSFNVANETLLATVTTNISSAGGINLLNQSYVYSPLQQKYSIWVAVTSPTFPNTIFLELKADECETELPVTLVSFDLIDTDDGINLNWQTSSETNSDYFDLQRSSDMKNFVDITRIAAQKEANTLSVYSYKDTYPLAKEAYYRLKMVDQDGSYEYSRVISYKKNLSESPITLLGNPVISGNNIRFDSNNIPVESIRITDINGVEIHNSYQNTGNHYEVKLQNTPKPGIYFMRISNKSDVRQFKVLIN